MTTQNLDQILIDNLQEAMNAAADNVRMRTREITTRVNDRNAQREQDARDAAVAARLIDQRHADDTATDMEEARQLARILGLDVGDQDGNGQADSNNGSADQPAQPPAPDNPFMPPPAPANPAPTTPAPANLAPTTQPSLLGWIRSWKWIEWVCAIILAFVALRWIAPATDQWVAGTVFGLDPDPETGDSSFWRSLVMTIWWILVIVAGFLIGGLIGSFIRSFFEGFQEERQQQDQPPAA